MEYLFTNKDGLGKIRFLQNNTVFEQNYFQQKQGFTFHTFAFNTGNTQFITVDNVKYEFAKNTVLPIMMNQSFSFERPEDIFAWQFNREFYCILNHDAEVGCVGFLFFGPSPIMFIDLQQEHLDKLYRLIDLFEEEFQSEEDIKGEMLRMLLVRLIIKLTRLAKKQYVKSEVIDDRFHLIRQYNLLVEIHFRKERQVQFYAGQLNKSPKTISNFFSLYFKKTPLQVIHERIITEAKRLFYYTDKSVKEIADELGFDDAGHFSKFFKNITSLNPSDFKNSANPTN
jgi:AraC-like DNA-binding protein